MNAEQHRLAKDAAGEQPWKLWGPYLSERQWGTVREDYSQNGDAWAHLPHDLARSRTYRWGEDGLAGISDDQSRLCLGLGLWNERDPILKERLFGLTGPEGNHGEDVKEIYYYLDATPTHSYLKFLYKYPQREFPYAELVHASRAAGRNAPEPEILETEAFADERYFDIFVEYAKAGPTDILMQVTAHNRGPDTAPLHLLPQIWLRDTWSWGAHLGMRKPWLSLAEPGQIAADCPGLGSYFAWFDGDAELLFCENQSNPRRMPGGAKRVRGYFKDAFHDCVVRGKQHAVNPNQMGTKAAGHYRFDVPSGQAVTVRLRLAEETLAEPFGDFQSILAERQADADAFYEALQQDLTDADDRLVQRQALAGMIWSKQFYYYEVDSWLDGDPGRPDPPTRRQAGRNSDWRHLHNSDIISMPDKWEYPWYAAWDLAFHCLPLAMVDPEFAKHQLDLITRERYMHPNGQLPAYEWAFGDVNPPVHAWAAWRVYQIDRKHTGRADRPFLERVFHKLLLNFTWWVNRKDDGGNNVFQGGFLGLDNIGVFDRSKPIAGGHIDQADGTSWMAMYSLNMLRIALELAHDNPVYEDIATKFFEHFLYIAQAMNQIGSNGSGGGLWDEEDEFYYDRLHLENGPTLPMKVRSLVGLTPLFAVETIEPETLSRLPNFAARMEWFLDNRPELASLVSRWREPGRGDRRLLSLLRGHRMKCLLKRMLDESEFLSDYGVRALSRYHLEHPYTIQCDGHRLQCDGGEATVRYEPAESSSAMFGGNSNWRGPIWLPTNFLLIESLQKFHYYYGDDFLIECPTGSGQMMTIQGAADEVARRLTQIFRRDAEGRRAVFGHHPRMQTDPHFRDHVLFYEYFHGDTGRGVGASHQTGWTGLIAKLLQPRRPDALDSSVIVDHHR